MKTVIGLFAACSILGAGAVQAQTVIAGCKIEPNAQCAKAKLLRANFIMRGVAVPAGEHQGVRDAEWIMRRATIPVLQGACGKSLSCEK